MGDDNLPVVTGLSFDKYVSTTEETEKKQKALDEKLKGIKKDPKEVSNVTVNTANPETGEKTGDQTEISLFESIYQEPPNLVADLKSVRYKGLNVVKNQDFIHMYNFCNNPDQNRNELSKLSPNFVKWIQNRLTLAKSSQVKREDTTASVIFEEVHPLPQPKLVGVLADGTELYESQFHKFQEQI